jgi:hypothetical protein
VDINAVVPFRVVQPKFTAVEALVALRTHDEHPELWRSKREVGALMPSELIKVLTVEQERQGFPRWTA